jgi:hypothetical protein
MEEDIAARRCLKTILTGGTCRRSIECVTSRFMKKTAAAKWSGVESNYFCELFKTALNHRNRLVPTLARRPMPLGNGNFQNKRCDYVLGHAVHNDRPGRRVHALVHMLRFKEKA